MPANCRKPQGPRSRASTPPQRLHRSVTGPRREIGRKDRNFYNPDLAKDRTQKNRRNLMIFEGYFASAGKAFRQHEQCERKTGDKQRRTPAALAPCSGCSVRSPRQSRQIRGLLWVLLLGTLDSGVSCSHFSGPEGPGIPVTTPSLLQDPFLSVAQAGVHYAIQARLLGP